MASSWGNSWGTSWLNSWSANSVVVVPPPVVVVEQSGAGRASGFSRAWLDDANRKRERERPRQHKTHRVIESPAKSENKAERERLNLPPQLYDALAPNDAGALQRSIQRQVEAMQRAAIAQAQQIADDDAAAILLLLSS